MHKYQPEGSFDWNFAKTARSMQTSQARDLRERLSKNPNDIDSRRLLFERYNKNHSKSILPHLIWFIDNHPKNAVLQFMVWSKADDVYREARKHWVKKVRSSPDDVTILCHASHFVEINEPLLAAKFLQKASEIDIVDDELPRRLSHVFKLKAITCPSRVRYYLRKSIEQMNIAIKRYAVPSDEDSYLLPYFKMELSGLADAALELNLLSEANDLAQILLRHGEINETRLRTKSDPNIPTYQRSKHSGHAIMTVIALRSENINEAKTHLSCMKSLINEQWPNDAIVHGLLKLGEFDLAMEYLGQIHQHWKNKAGLGYDPNAAPANKDYAKNMEQDLSKIIKRIRKQFKPS